jgi:hypothetical protein
VNPGSLNVPLATGAGSLHAVSTMCSLLSCPTVSFSLSGFAILPRLM